MITDWLDNTLRYFADLQGRPVDEYSAQLGGEGIATAGEWFADQFAKPLLSMIVQFAAAVLAGSYATWVIGVPVRTRRELAQMSAHWGMRVSKMLHFPTGIEVRRNLDDVIRAGQRGDLAGVATALLKSPAELQGMFMGIVAAPTAPPTAPTPERPQPYTPAPIPEIRGDHVVGPAFGPRSVPYGVSVPQAPFGAQSTVGRYVVAEQGPWGQQSPTAGKGRFS